MMLRPAFANFKKTVDYSEYGGAPLLGVNGVCIIAHGRSTAKAIKNAIRVAGELIESRINEHIVQDLQNQFTLLGGESQGLHFWTRVKEKTRAFFEGRSGIGAADNGRQRR
jgi:glycerol-3-phosphate acyltransferase PlsX